MAGRIKPLVDDEGALRERLNLATETARIAIWDKDLVSGKFVTDQRFWEYFGMDATNENFRPMDGIHADERAQILPSIFALLNDPTRNEMLSLRHRTSNPTQPHQYVQSHIRVFRNDEGKAIRLLGVTWDVTQDVENQRRLQEQAEQLGTIKRRLERASLSSSEGHWEAEIQTGNLWCSSSFHTLLGYTQGELENRVNTLDRLVHESDRTVYLDALREHLQNDSSFSIELRLRMHHGEYRWFHVSGMAERNSDGHAQLMAGSIRDIHQQRLAEDTLQLVQHRFERAINGTQDGLWEIDVGTGNAWCSPRLAGLLGYPQSELEGINFLTDLVHAEDSVKVTQVMQAHYRDDVPFDLELRLQTRSGNYRWYRARGAAERDSTGTTLRLSGSLRDVTEALAAREELLRATAAAEAANRAKSSFLANVSHEIRTPMNGIIGMTGLLLSTPLNRMQYEYSETIRSSADSLLAVINDILDFSKIEAGKLELEAIDMDLRSNVEDVVAIMSFQAAAKNLDLIVNVDPELPDRVRGDPQRLRQCLINLVGNAIKFTQHGEVVVEIHAVGRHDGRVLTHFEVRDTGIGIKSEVLPTLFQPFNQADPSITRHFGGTGLGLSIVQRLIELMGGQVGVVSEFGLGSTFFFTLSLEPLENPLEETTDAAARGHILIVDNNEVNRRVVTGQLVHVGHRVQSIGDGHAALALLRSNALNGNTPIDVVIIDYQMPDMSGVELGEYIARDQLLNKVRMIALTLLDTQDDAQKFRELGFTAYLTKPVRSRELLQCVARALTTQAREWQMETHRMITPSALTQSFGKQRFIGKVLLVEDHPVNQKVAVRYLERMGCIVTVADNGAVGVAAFEREPFDIILMDVQMPVMDGLAAARKIREIEITRGEQRRTPIVALTANVMRGDQERCAEAGMDSFLTKPVDVDRLREILTNFGLQVTTNELESQTGRHKATASSHDVSNVLTHAGSKPPLDIAKIIALTEGDAQFALEVFETFLTSSQAQFEELQAAHRDSDRTGLARAAHKLKGACVNIYAARLAQLATTLESQAELLNAESIATMLHQIEQELAQVCEYIAAVDASALTAASL
jgi:two-component system, sensor histidine kinase and response regulator